MNVEFPITAENFCEVQCQLIGRPVEGRWREIIDMIIPTINEAYEMGKRGQNAHLDAEDIAALLTSPPGYCARVWRNAAELVRACQ